jgi:hypothetical protein
MSYLSLYSIAPLAVVVSLSFALFVDWQSRRTDEGH